MSAFGDLLASSRRMSSTARSARFASALELTASDAKRALLAVEDIRREVRVLHLRWN